MTVVTSKPSPVQIGQARNKETIYTATRTTKMADGTYSVEMLQYSNAKGQGGKVIAERDSVNEWTFKDGVSKKIKQNEGRLNEASKNQMESMRGDFVTKSQETEEYNRAQGEPNKATETESGDSQSAAPPTTNNTKVFENMQYPETIAEGQDVIQFTALSYAAKTITGFSFGGRDRVAVGAKGGRSKGTVTLPIQSGIKDSNSAGWGNEEMNPMEAMMAKSALGLVRDGNADQIGKAGEQIQKNTKEFQDGVGAAVVSSATGVKNILSRTEGKVVNPNLELLFQKPTLRPFSFQFRMSARSAPEAKQIIAIIRFFKQNMAPQKGGGSGGESANLFLKAPNTFQVHYLHRGKGGSGEHKFIGKMKECAMLQFDVDYTPDGNYSTYEDGVMTSYTISLTMKELEPVFSEDYDDSVDSIGF